MRTLLLAAAVAVLAAPAWAAGSGRIGCEKDVQAIVDTVEANPTLAQQRVRDLDDWIPVVLVQCRADWGWAQANIRALRAALGDTGPQTASTGFIEWADVAGMD